MAVYGMSSTLETKWNTLSAARTALAAWQSQDQLNRTYAGYNYSSSSSYQQQQVTLAASVNTALADYMALRATEQAALGNPVTLPV